MQKQELDRRRSNARLQLMNTLRMSIGLGSQICNSLYLGATGTVTGSRYLLECGHARLLSTSGASPSG